MRRGLEQTPRKVLEGVAEVNNNAPGHKGHVHPHLQRKREREREREQTPTGQKKQAPSGGWEVLEVDALLLAVKNLE